MPALKPPPPNLPERIAALRAEIDLVIDQMAADEAKKTPGARKAVIRKMSPARATSCRCRNSLIRGGFLNGAAPFGTISPKFRICLRDWGAPLTNQGNW